MAPTIVLVTGGNRGLGQGLVKRFLAQPNHVSTQSALVLLLLPPSRRYLQPNEP